MANLTPSLDDEVLQKARETALRERTSVNALAAFDVVTTNVNLVLDAHELAVTEQLSWFDALIAEAAIRSGCGILFSEGFNHGQKLCGLAVCNPFLEVPTAIPEST